MAARVDPMWPIGCIHNLGEGMTLRQELTRLIAATEDDKLPELVLDLMLLALEQGSDKARLSELKATRLTDLVSSSTMYSYRLEAPAERPLSQEALYELNRRAAGQPPCETDIYAIDKENYTHHLIHRSPPVQQTFDQETIIRPSDRY